ncbi:response regulator [Sediminibacterium soli]|uniref:response regulator n=1 Tax=Sediminibacterium soli TaxID=2698829 RepID=UPI00137A79D8|nr:response regulator [Sediminibacterium soli]NCI46572.1 response regulator [Sediminibacterium soli]
MHTNTTGKVILVADDDIDDQEMISDSFRGIDSACTVEVVSNGQQVIDRIRDNSLPRPCLVVLDLNMPVLDGMETLTRIRSTGGLDDVPIVVFTTSNSKESRKQSLTLGALDYIVKPNDYHGLMEVTAKMMQYCREEN